MASSNVVASPSSSQVEDIVYTRPRGASVQSIDRRSERTHRSSRQGSIMNPAQRSSIAVENNGEGVLSPTHSQSSAIAAGIPYDDVSTNSRRSGVASESPVTAITSVSDQVDAAAQPRLSAHSKKTLPIGIPH
jgi:hypothetical protein